MSYDTSTADVESFIRTDMEAQIRWHKMMKPKASMLKFRLPYSAGETEYLDGDIFFQVWAGRTSTESRLVVTDPEPKMKTYDHTHYGEIMFHFNTVTRTIYWPHNVVGQGLNHCYYCAAEIYILQNYLRKIKNTPEELINEETAALSRIITDKISNSMMTLDIFEQ
eukprot:TRINITY_DN8796_c0_g1_i1.p1 TRINITY_DN8796_c0_g1~~TRINITY_DN8796_c0_g1_i1.p1  ORF type:complete len:166 (-),score=24.40 TRINITY_DN8796_c0_g1_i1:114-611(-)